MRNTTRPFLNVERVYLDEAKKELTAALRVTVKNTGNMPAKGVLMDIFLRDYNNRYSNGMPLNEDLVLPSMCFPGESVGPSRHEVSATQRNSLSGNFVVIKISYKDLNSKEHYETVRGFWVNTTEEQRQRRLESPKGFVPEAKLDSCK